MFSSRSSRILLGVGMLGAAGYAFAPHLTHRISNEAVVNSEVVRIVAPMDGIVEEALPAAGTVLAANTPRPLVRRLVEDDRELHRLSHDLAVARAQIADAREGLIQLDALDRTLADRVAAHGAAARQRIEAELAEARASLAGAEAAVTLARAELAHVRSLHASRHVASVRVEAAEAALRQAEAAAEGITARIARLAVEQRAAASGLQLRDGQNDVPYSVQQRERVLFERRALTERLGMASAREATLAAALAAEEAARLGRTRYAFTPEHDAMVWRRHATPGAPVKPGETLLDLVRCDALFIEVSLPDTAFSALATGQPALVHLRGGPDVEGTIRSIRGAGARNGTALLAAHRPGDPDARLTVEVALPPGSAARIAPEGGGGFCGIGRLAEVSFPAGLGAATDLADRIGALARALGNVADRAIGLVASLGTARAAP